MLCAQQHPGSCLCPLTHLCLCKWPAPVSALTSSLLSHLIRKEVYFKCCVIYEGKPLGPAIHLSSQGHTCRGGASILEVTHIYFSARSQCPGGAQESSLNYKRVSGVGGGGGGRPSPRTTPPPLSPIPAPARLSLPLNHLVASRPL